MKIDQMIFFFKTLKAVAMYRHFRRPTNDQVSCYQVYNCSGDFLVHFLNSFFLFFHYYLWYDIQPWKLCGLFPFRLWVFFLFFFIANSPQKKKNMWHPNIDPKINFVDRNLLFGIIYYVPPKSHVKNVPPLFKYLPKT